MPRWRSAVASLLRHTVIAQSMRSNPIPRVSLVAIKG